MKAGTSAATGNQPGPNHGGGTLAAPRLSLVRLYVLRAGYLLLAVGNAVTEWPPLIHHDARWPLMEGVVTCMLVALSALALLGLRYPVHMLPLLLFEVAWKVIWLGAVALPLWTAGQLDPAAAETAGECSLVVVVLAVIPWRHVLAQYGAKRGDRWRSGRAPEPS